MKKITVILLVLLTASCIFAGTNVNDFEFEAVEYKPIVSDRKGSVAYRLFSNPADLYGTDWAFEVPSVSFTSYNDSKLLSDAKSAKYISEMLSLRFNKENIVGLLSNLAKNVGSSVGRVANADVQFGFAVKNFAFAFNAQVRVHSYAKNIVDLATLKLYPEANAAFSVGYGYRVYEKGSTSVDIGASVRFAGRLYTDAFSAESLYNGSKIDFSQIKFTSGYALPISLSAQVNFLNDLLSVNLAMTNLNGTYHMQEFTKIEDAVKYINGTNEYSLKTPASFDLCATFDPHLQKVNPTVTLKIESINQFLSSDIESESQEFLKYITLKGNVRVLNLINAYVAYEGGYLGCGCTFGYRGNEIELHYGWEELGKKLGSKPTDFLTFAVKLGWDNN